MCGINRLKNSPIIRLKCSHYFHYDCVIHRLEKKWNTNEVNLTFTKCPICNQKISASFKLYDDNQLIQEVNSFIEHMKNLIINQIQKDSLSLDISSDSDYFLDHALRTLNFYECNLCNNIYFGGIRDCGEMDDHENHFKHEMICSSCKNYCSLHGSDHMIYKCRFCCTIASYFCFGHSHFCETCHPNAFHLLHGKNQDRLKNTVPQCAGKDSCPLQLDHPPNGEEFAIGCAICKEQNVNKNCE